MPKLVQTLLWILLTLAGTASLPLGGGSRSEGDHPKKMVGARVRRQQVAFARGAGPVQPPRVRPALGGALDPRLRPRGSPPATGGDLDLSIFETDDTAPAAPDPSSEKASHADGGTPVA